MKAQRPRFVTARTFRFDGRRFRCGGQGPGTPWTWRVRWRAPLRGGGGPGGPGGPGTVKAGSLPTTSVEKYAEHD